MPILIVLSVVALMSLTGPFRALAFRVLLLGAAACFGIAVILWRFWIDCRNVVSFALGRGPLYHEEEEAHHFHATFSNFPPSLGAPIPLRLPVLKRGKGSHTETP